MSGAISSQLNENKSEMYVGMCYLLHYKYSNETEENTGKWVIQWAIQERKQHVWAPGNLSGIKQYIKEAKLTMKHCQQVCESSQMTLC